MRNRVFACAAALLVAAGPTIGQQAKTLDFYFIDVEGGAATLVVTPTGDSALIDSGNPGERDAGRIAKVAKEVAKLEDINFILTTHWHSDHFGGLGRLSELMALGQFFDHGLPGDPLPKDIAAPLIETYRKVSRGESRTLEPGRTVGETVQLQVLASGGRVIGDTSATPQIRPCGDDFKPKPEDTSDNANSLAFRIAYGKFDMYIGGDLTWNVEHRLVCPKPLVQPVDVFLVAHHGLDQSNHPALVKALAPRVTIMNNGARKGAEAGTVATVRAIQGHEAVFQLHRNVRADDLNAPPAFIANDPSTSSGSPRAESRGDEEQCAGHYIKLSVEEGGGRYTITVPSKGTTKTYDSR